MKTRLERKCELASERERDGRPLDVDEKLALIEDIRREKNIDPEVDSEQIYNDYVINN